MIEGLILFNLSVTVGGLAGSRGLSISEKWCMENQVNIYLWQENGVTGFGEFCVWQGYGTPSILRQFSEHRHAA